MTNQSDSRQDVYGMSDAPVGRYFGNLSVMPIVNLNHYFVRAHDLEKTKQFYTDVLGLEEVSRPNFPFPGYWLGKDGVAQVHMGPASLPERETYYLGTPADAVNGQSGVIDHVAFLASDPPSFIERFKSAGLNYRPRHFPEAGLYQLFVRDPNGLMIELNFMGIHDAPDWGGDDYSRMKRVT